MGMRQFIVLETFAQLEVYWTGFVRKMKIKGAPAQLKEVINVINRKLETMYGHER